MNTNVPPGKSNTYKANFMLQQKIGVGPVDETAIKKSQEAMDNNDVDFTPMAMEYLGKLEQALAQAKDASIDLKVRKQALTSPVMELKANAAIFKYDLIGALANIMLSFLEAVSDIDKHVVEIVGAHHKTLQAILLKKMKGDGGEAGKMMASELKDACARYFAKKEGP